MSVVVVQLMGIAWRSGEAADEHENVMQISSCTLNADVYSEHL